MASTIDDRGHGHQFMEFQATHTRYIEGLIERLRRTAADLFEVPYLEGVILDRVESFREPRITRQYLATSFLEVAEDWLSGSLPHPWRGAWAHRRWEQRIAYLVNRNVEEWRWTTRQAIDLAVRQFQNRMEAEVHAVKQQIWSTLQQLMQRRSAVEAVYKVHAAAREHTRTELTRVRAQLDDSGEWSGPVV